MAKKYKAFIRVAGYTTKTGRVTKSHVRSIWTTRKNLKKSRDYDRKLRSWVKRGQEPHAPARQVARPIKPSGFWITGDFMSGSKVTSTVTVFVPFQKGVLNPTGAKRKFNEMWKEFDAIKNVREGQPSKDYYEYKWQKGLPKGGKYHE